MRDKTKMGREKLTMKLIVNEKSRKTTFLKRKKSLMRKAYELSTLCDVRLCVLIYGPKQDNQSAGEVHTWPECRTDVDGLIGAYKCNNKRARKVSDLYDFFSERKKKIEAEISKLQKVFAEIKYPRWNDCLDYLLEDQLRLLIDELDLKIDEATCRMDQFITEQIPMQTPMFGNSFFNLPMDNDIDLSQLFFGSNVQAQIQYNNHPHFQSSIYDDSITETMENNNAMTVIDPNFSIHHAMPTEPVLPLPYMQFIDQASCSSNSQMTFADASDQVSDQFDFINYQYMMKMNNFLNTNGSC